MFSVFSANRRLDPRALGLVYLLLATVIWGSSFVAQRVGMQTLGPLTYASARYLLAVLALAFFFVVLRAKRKASGVKLMNVRETIVGGVFCGLLSFVATITQQIGIVTATSGKAGFLTAMYIVFTPIMGVFVRRKTTKMVWFAALIGLLGMALICYEPSVVFIAEDLWLVACAIFFTFQIMLVDKYAARIDAILFMLVSSALCLVLSIICMFVWENPSELNSFSLILANWFPLVFSGVFSGAIAYTLQVIGQKNAHPSIASLVMSLESVFAALFGWLILSETMSALQTIGCVLMFAATVAATSPQWKRGDGSASIS